MIDLTVKTLDSQNHAFSLEDDQITVRGFKEYIAEAVAVSADSQRLIYCGRVLQDEKKLNDYDVNGKVIHLVQRAPPQPGQRGNDGGQSQSQNHGSQAWQNPQRTHYRLTRAQMHGNAMYLVEAHGLQVPQLSNSLSNSRLIVARRMLDRANELMDRLDDPTCPLNPQSSESNEPPLAQQVQVEQLATEHYTNEGRTNGGTRLVEAAAATLAAALSAAGANNVTFLQRNGDDGAEAVPVNEANDDNQPDAQEPQHSQQSQSEPQGSTSTNDGPSNRRSAAQLPRPPQMAELLERLLNTQDRLRPYIERYRVLMLADPSLPVAAGPEGVDENQRIVDGVSECLHYVSHACHALSDIIVDMGQQPPRNLRCRPIVIQHSAVMHSGIPIQVEAHISLQSRNANNNNGNEENGDSTSTLGQSESNEASNEEDNQRPESEAGAQPTEQQQEQTQSPFGTVFNLPNNVEVLMEVSPEGNISAASGSEQAQAGESNNNNNNNGGRAGGAAGAFPWGSNPPADFIRNLMQAVAGHMVQGGISTTTISTQNPPTAGGQQTVASHDGNAAAGQSTQARSNVGTHPTTATQTRSTSRPHVFHQQTHPLGVGMSIGQGLDFDPILPCNSHHVRRTSTTTSSTSQGTQTSQTSTTETQSQAQTATTSTMTSNTTSSNTTPVTTSQTNANHSFRNLLQQVIRATGNHAGINVNNTDLADSFGSVMQMFTNQNVRVGIIGDRSGNSSEGPTLAELLPTFTSLMTTQDSANHESLFTNLCILLLQNITLEDVLRLRLGGSEPIAHLRRPLQEFFQNTFPNTTTEAMQEQVIELLFSQLRPHLQNLLVLEEDFNGRSGSRIDICATVEALLRRPVREILQILFNADVTDARFGQETATIVNNGGRQLCAVLRYSISGGQAGLEAIASRFFSEMLEGSNTIQRHWMLNLLFVPYRTYLRHIMQPPDSEILPLLIYKDVPAQQLSTPSAPVHQPSQTQSEVEPMETEVVEERTNFEAAVPDDGDEIPETFPGHEALPSDWVPIIARDGVRQRRQLQMQGMTNGGVATFSDAYLGTLPTKRRKLIEQQKPRLLVSPTPNHSAIAASMERLVREGVSRAGVEDVEGAAVAVAVDPGVRRAFGQAIRDCLNPRGYGTPDFPDPLRFPNATKYFADQDGQPK
ncbi:large proline-rich protein BAG6 isoform X3 [Andrena cerasifolii]|uniref:large proline-rich protein BAG6 isoform X3 n=1 Tax=Andrena cerasifolii TaxID=2819439 RepID=UPI004037E5C0